MTNNGHRNYGTTPNNSSGSLADAFKAVRKWRAAPVAKLMRALKVVVNFSVEHPARYRLLFNDPVIAAEKGELKQPLSRLLQSSSFS